MANAKAIFEQLDNLLIMNDLTEVKLKLFKAENDRGKMAYHVEAEWQEAKKVVNKAKTGFEYINGQTEKVEEINKYFSSELFVAGITQRKAFIKAGYEKQVEAFKNGLMHPAMYKEA
jgi:hypothetical protein